MVELGQAIKDLKEEISRPRHNFGFLENLDASACWLALFWSFTTLYNQLMKDGLPWLYVCFHIGTFYLTIRAVFRIYLMFRHKAGWEEISRFNHFLLFLTGVSSLVDVWASGRYNYHLSLSLTIFLSIFGSYNLYCGVMNAINVCSRQLKTVTEQMGALSKLVGSLSGVFTPEWRQIKSCFNSTTILDRTVWPIRNPDSPFYERPDLLLRRLEKLQKEFTEESPAIFKPLYTLDFWSVKRKLRSLIKNSKATRISTEVA